MKKDIFWNSIGTAAWSFLSLFLLIAVTRINGITDSGLFSFAFSFALIMFTVACYGGRAYQVSDHKNLFDANNYISLRIVTSLAVIIISIVFVTLNGYDWQKTMLILLLVGHRISDAMADVFYGIMQKREYLHISGKSLFLKSILSLIIFVLIDLLTKDLLLATLSLPIISALFVVLYDIPQSKKLESFNLKPRVNTIEKILKSSFLPFATTVTSLVFVNLARYFVDIYHPELQGYFGIIIMPLSLIILLFSFITTPAILNLSNNYNNQEFTKLNQSIRKIITFTLSLTLLFCILTYYFGILLLNLLFNIDFTSYAFDLVLIVIIGFAISLSTLFTNIAIIARKLKPTTVIYLSSSLLLITLCLLLVDELQVRGAIVAYIVASSLQAIATGIYYVYLIRNYSRSKKS